MERLEAIKELERHHNEFVNDHGWNTSVSNALEMAIADMRKLRYLEGRPCEVCSCHNEKGCGVWECMFDGKENV